MLQASDQTVSLCCQVDELVEQLFELLKNNLIAFGAKACQEIICIIQGLESADIYRH
jgi:hypothetical protein